MLMESTTYTYFPNLTDLVTEIPKDSIVSRTIYKDEKTKAVLFGFATGQELSEHTASTPAVIQILSGECRLILGEDVMEAKAGAWVYMPAQMPHSLLARTEVTMLLLLMH